MTVDPDHAAALGGGRRGQSAPVRSGSLIAGGVARLHMLLGARAPASDIELIVWSGLFDAAWYRSAYADLVGRQRPLLHFAREGAASGLDPNAWFSTEDYVRRHGAAIGGGRIPLAHFIEAVLAAGLDPRRRGDVAAYLRSEAPPPAAGAQALAVRRSEPSKLPAAATNLDLRLMAASELFDAAWYAAAYPDVAASGLDPIEHFTAIGAFEGKDPGPNFSTVGYLEDNPDVARSGTNAFLHFLRYGHAEGRPAGRLRRRVTDLFPAVRRLGPPEYGPVTHLARHDRVPDRAPDVGPICVHVHLFYLDQAATILAALANIGTAYTLLVSIPPDQSAEVWHDHLSDQVGTEVSVVVRAVENRGRDVLPWLTVFRAYVAASSLFCHVHTKRSTHLRQHRDWGRFLLHSTLGSPGIVADILDLFAADPKLGLVFPPYFASLSAQPSWNANHDRALALLESMGLPIDPARCPDYPAGSFFWVRPAALQPLLARGLEATDFDDELGQHDGTLAHAIERVIGALPPLLGYRVACVGTDIAYNMIRDFDAARPPPVAALRRAVGDRPVGGRIAVCTQFDDSGSPPFGCADRQPGAQYYCFTRGEAGREPVGYRPIQVRSTGAAQSAAGDSFAKAHLSTYFAGYDFVFWHDPDVVFAGDLNDYVAVLDDAGAEAGFVLDPVIDGVVAGADAAVALSPRSRGAVVGRLERYRSDPELVASRYIEPSFIAVRPGAPAVHRLFATWWQELNLLPREAAALGVPYAVRRSGARITTLLPDGWSPRDHADFAVVDRDYPAKAALTALLRGSPSAARTH